MDIYYNYRLDGEANPLYWGPYRAMWEKLSGTLLIEPGMRLLPEECRHYSPFAISILSKGDIEWTHLDFTRADRSESLYGLPIGKSAQIDFTGNAGLGYEEIDMNMVTDAVLGRGAKHTDQLYGAYIEGIERAGWQVHWTPLPQHPLHVLLVPTESFYDPNYKPPKRLKDQLLRSFWRIK